jgi:hypothetical protein
MDIVIKYPKLITLRIGLVNTFGIDITHDQRNNNNRIRIIDL